MSQTNEERNAEFKKSKEHINSVRRTNKGIVSMKQTIDDLIKYGAVKDKKYYATLLRKLIDNQNYSDKTSNLNIGPLHNTVNLFRNRGLILPNYNHTVKGYVSYNLKTLLNERQNDAYDLKDEIPPLLSVIEEAIKGISDEIVMNTRTSRIENLESLYSDAQFQYNLLEGLIKQKEKENAALAEENRIKAEENRIKAEEKKANNEAIQVAFDESKRIFNERKEEERRLAELKRIEEENRLAEVKRMEEENRIGVGKSLYIVERQRNKEEQEKQEKRLYSSAKTGLGRFFATNLYNKALKTVGIRKKRGGQYKTRRKIKTKKCRKTRCK